VRVARSLPELTEHRQAFASDRVVLVPTMGALHAGHASLIELARTLGDRIVVSIFVNPLQFGPDEDYARYPRPVSEDLAVCEGLGVDLAFVPSVTDLYPAGRQVTVNAGIMGSVLEGTARPGHFDGVLTVVLKLMHLVGPHTIVFGQKDAQQLACVQRMVTDLNLDIAVVGAPTVREPDGLARSSRNIFLSPADRGLAAGLSEAVARAQTESTIAGACAAAFAVLDRLAEEPHFQLDYATVVNPATFAEVDDSYRGPALFVLAAKVGGIRLIDNATLCLNTADEASGA
jgi:pantoate--beta-alanine ligase